MWTIVDLSLFRDSLMSLHHLASTFIHFNTWLLHKPLVFYGSAPIFALYTSTLLLISIQPQFVLLTAKRLGVQALFKGTFMLFTKGGGRFTLSHLLPRFCPWDGDSHPSFQSQSLSLNPSSPPNVPSKQCKHTNITPWFICPAEASSRYLCM